MKVLVCGGRDYWDRQRVFDELDALPGVSAVIHGGASGADQLAEEWGRSRGMVVREYLPDWKAYGKAAGPIRNKRMLDDGKPDLVLAFPGGRGTENMTMQAHAAGVDIHFVSSEMTEQR